jgi:mannosyltransferase OCH1-like enzyme
MLQGESFYAHLADYLRFVLLFREGGVYTDMDSILLQPIDETNVIGVEHCDQDTLDYCIHLTQFSKSDRFYLPIGTLPLFLLHWPTEKSF